MPSPRIAFRVNGSVSYHSTIEDFLASDVGQKRKGTIDLIFTSPPFPLNRKKRYGNLQGEEYVKWLSDLAVPLAELLSKKGSIVMEVGNSWEQGAPVMSTLALESLLQFLKKGNLYLCQQFIWNNSAKLPSPAQWVNVKRVRVKDSFTHIWWMSKTPNPEANNKRVLTEYSKSMKSLLRNGTYNSGTRPSEHNIGSKSFLKNNKGSIPSNVITASNTIANSAYQLYCKEKGIDPHPARMPIEIPRFFIKFLTKPKHTILDPFGGSNTTGEAAQELGRKWIAIEANKQYIKGSVGRFNGKKSVKLQIR